MPSSIVVNNNSSVDICFVWIAPAGMPFVEQLNGAVLSPSAGTVVRHPNQGPYDLEVLSCDQNSFWSNYNQFGDLTWELTD